MTFLEREVERICKSGTLGRSPVYGRLLRYLHTTTAEGRIPKEVDIAVEVFGRKDFDSSSDSSVRVYLHHLRHKLEAFYEAHPADSSEYLYVPRGEYRLAVASRSAGDADATAAPARRLPLAAFAAGALAALAVGAIAMRWLPPADEFAAVAASGVWRPVAEGDKPVVVVLGDYYIFGEVGTLGQVHRLIRDFRVNNAAELAAGYGEAGAYTDMRLSYLPTGTGAALADILNVLHAAGRETIVIPESSLDAKTVQASDIVYIGYLSGLGLLKEFVFASSNFEVGATYDELVRTADGTQYLSEAGRPEGPVQDYVDYGFMSTFAGPAGNRILIVAGMRDEGLMQMASILSSKDAIDGLLERAGDPGGPPAFEALYRVRGMNRMNIAAKLVFAGRLAARDIWVDGAPIRSAALPAAVSPESGPR